MDFVNKVICAFGTIMKKYNLQAKYISNNEVILFSSKYVLSFLFHSSELELVYIEKREDGELYQYNIDSFIANSISEEDRICLNENLQERSRIDKELILLAFTLEKKWDELLSGGKDWIKEYQNFILFIPPRNVTKLKANYIEKY